MERELEVEVLLPVIVVTGSVIPRWYGDRGRRRGVDGALGRRGQPERSPGRLVPTSEP